MRKSIYLLTTTPSSHTLRFHPLPLATPTSCSPHPLATPIHSTHSPQLSSILSTCVCASCICSFYSSIPTFFSVHFFVITFYVLNNFFSQYKHIPATTGVPRQPYEGYTYCFIHEEAHTNVRFISCDGHQLYERGVDLEVEGVRYIEMHRGPAAYVLGPPPSRGRDLELEGGVNACHVESRDSLVRGTE